MFHRISERIAQRMAHLERIDAQDRSDGTPQSHRLRQITPDTGRFLTMLAATTPAGAWLEIGTSAGYSALWLAQAARVTGRKLVTFELSPVKIALAEETFRLAGVEPEVELVAGDAREHLPNYPEIAFCFLDTEKELYAECYELVVPRLVPGGLLVADNAIDHRAALQHMLDRALADERVDALIVPIGKGELVCRKL
jgi:predicted O-methyltransferase YrrM